VNQQDRARVAQMVEACAALFDRSTTPDMVSLYIEALDGFSVDEVAAAFRSYMTGPQGKRFPLPAHLVEQLRGSGIDAAALALGTLKHAIASVGRYQSVVFEGDPMIGQAVEDMGGWVAVCGMDETGLVIQFQRCYSSRHNRGEQVEPQVCHGLHARANERLGWSQHPVRIGGRVVPLLGRAAMALPAKQSADCGVTE